MMAVMIIFGMCFAFGVLYPLLGVALVKLSGSKKAVWQIIDEL